MFAYTLTPNSINLFIRGKARTVDRTHANYEAIKEKLKKKPAALTAGWIADLEDLISVPTFIAKITEGRVKVSDDTVLVNGHKAHGHAVTRLYELMQEGFDIRPLCRFLDKLHDNPTEAVKEDLYLWLEASKMPLTEDGDFLAYKYVGTGYKSRGGFDNPIGHVVSMPREQCDSDRHQTCSSGLHFASWDYVWNSGAHKLILKINPRDVVAIPSDYDNHKGRACQYEIIGEVGEEQKFERVVSTFGTYEEPLETVTEVEPDRAEEHFEHCGCGEEHNDNQQTARLAETEDALPQRPKIHVDETTGEPTFYPPKYAPFNSYQLIAAVEGMNQRKFALEYGVPRTTLQGWLRKANEWMTRNKRKKKK